MTGRDCNTCTFLGVGPCPTQGHEPDSPPLPDVRASLPTVDPVTDHAAFEAVFAPTYLTHRIRQAQAGTLTECPLGNWPRERGAL